MNFGFSYVGLIMLLMLFVPNLLWTKNKPAGYDKFEKNESKVLRAFERVGEVLVSTSAVVFSDFNVKQINLWLLWLAGAFLCMIFYEIYWLRYFKGEKTMQSFYSSLFGIPVAGATLPVCAFFLLGTYGKNVIMLVSVAILAVGHIGIHLNHKKEISRV